MEPEPVRCQGVIAFTGDPRDNDAHNKREPQTCCHHAWTQAGQQLVKPAGFFFGLRTPQADFTEHVRGKRAGERRDSSPPAFCQQFVEIESLHDFLNESLPEIPRSLRDFCVKVVSTGMKNARLLLALAVLIGANLALASPSQPSPHMRFRAIIRH